LKRTVLALVAVVCLFTLAAFADGPDNNTANTAVEPVKPSETQSQTPPDSGHVGVGVHVGLNGIGFETATRLTHKSNLRGGLDFLPGFKPHFTTDSGIAFDGKVGLKTMKVQYDFFPRAGGFHISPGLLVSMSDNLLTATAHSTAGESFDVGNNSYISDPSHPVKGSMKVSFGHRVAPMFTVGFGNLVSRKEGKHFTVPFEAGLAFTGAPKSVWSYSGNVCTTTGYDPVTFAPITSCGPASGNQQFKVDVLTEQNKFNHSASSFKVYPIVSIGLGYKF